MHTEALIMCLAGRCMPRHYIGRARDTPFGDRFAVDGERMKLTQIKQKKGHDADFYKTLTFGYISEQSATSSQSTTFPVISFAIT